MSMEATTQRLTAALEGLELQLARRLEAAHAEQERLHRELAAAKSEVSGLKLAAAQAAATPADTATGISAAAYAALEQSNAQYRATLSRTLENLDSLIGRVESAIQ
jgi:hypothetical protein